MNGAALLACSGAFLALLLVCRQLPTPTPEDPMNEHDRLQAVQRGDQTYRADHIDDRLLHGGLVTVHAGGLMELTPAGAEVLRAGCLDAVCLNPGPLPLPQAVQ
jgi:hypothetical protein